MSDLGDEIRRYYEEIVERVDPMAQTTRRRDPVSYQWRRGVAIAAFTALVVLILFGVLPLLVPPDSEPVAPSSTSPDTTVATTAVESSSTSVPTTSLPQERSETGLGDLPDAPWSQDFLTPDSVNPVLLDAWSSAANRGYCSLLAPASLGSEGSEAKPSVAGFTPELDWSIAWDNPSGPGMAGTSELCEDCGRSAFGVQGSELLNDGAEPTWSDGSGVTLHPQEGQYADGHRRVLANLVVAGQPCLYQVWSSFGEAHLEWFIDQLRFVDGYYSEPIEAGFDEVEVVQMGSPAWTGPPLPAEAVEPLLIERWEQEAEGSQNRECPLLVLDDLGPGNEQAHIRTADFGGWGVAWDNPNGPGHDGRNQPCSDCGRGAVGLSGGRGSIEVAPPARPYRAEWDDGSQAIFGYEGNLHNQLPADRIDLRDPITGDPATPRLHAWLEIADEQDCIYELWTHLGQDHLHYLFTQLRYVTGHP